MDEASIGLTGIRMHISEKAVRLRAASTPYNEEVGESPAEHMSRAQRSCLKQQSAIVEDDTTVKFKGRAGEHGVVMCGGFALPTWCAGSERKLNPSPDAFVAEHGAVQLAGGIHPHAEFAEIIDVRIVERGEQVAEGVGLASALDRSCKALFVADHHGFALD